MKLSKLVDDRFHVILHKLGEQSLPLKTAFKLKGIIKTSREEYIKYDEVRQGALQKHGLKNEDGSLKLDDRSVVQFSEEGMDAFRKELNELLEMEIELPTLKLSELGNNIQLTVEELETIDGVITED